MRSPLVSILIPCYNAERYIAASIRSAIEQEYAPIEVIVVDDGSTDGSLNVIKQFASEPNFRWETGPNQGGNAARNRLLELSDGEYIQFHDADDLLAPTKLRLQMDKMNDDIDVVFCDYSFFIDGQSPPGRPMGIPCPSISPMQYVIDHRIQTSVPLHRREHLLQVNGFDETLPCCQEFDLHMRLAHSQWRKLGYVPQVLSHLRDVTGSVSSDETRVFTNKSRILSQWWATLSNEGEVPKQLACALARRLYWCGRHLAKANKTSEAQAAFQLSRSIAPRSKLGLSNSMSMLTFLFGPYHAERLRQRVRNFAQLCQRTKSP